MSNGKPKTRKEHEEDARLESTAAARYDSQPMRYFLMLRSKEKMNLIRAPLQEYDLYPWHDFATDYWTAFIFETFDGAFTRRVLSEIKQKIQRQIPNECVRCDLVAQPCDWVSVESEQAYAHPYVLAEREWRNTIDRIKANVRRRWM